MRLRVGQIRHITLPLIDRYVNLPGSLWADLRAANYIVKIDKMGKGKDAKGTVRVQGVDNKGLTVGHLWWVDRRNVV